MSDDMSTDKELGALMEVSRALDGLDSEQVVRVLRWANDRYVGSRMTVRSSTDDEFEDAGDLHGLEATAGIPRDFADLYAMANPANDREKALVAAYWMQPDEETEDFTSQDANKELKRLGHGVGNITRAFDALTAAKPRLVMQTRKSGSTKQARKLYRITVSGRQRVQEMIREATE